MPSSSAEAVAIKPNAILINTQRAVIAALAASVQNGGAVRGEIVRGHRDNSYSVRTKDGEIQVKPQAAGTGAAGTANIQFKAGDPVRLDFPVEELKVGGSLALQISLLSPNALAQQEALFTARAKETPLSIQVNSPQAPASTPISARLDVIPAEKLESILAPITLNKIINSSVQQTDSKIKTIIDTVRSELLDAAKIIQSNPQQIKIGEIRGGDTAKTTLLTQGILPQASPQQTTQIIVPPQQTSVSPKSDGDHSVSIANSLNKGAFIPVLPQQSGGDFLAVPLPIHGKETGTPLPQENGVHQDSTSPAPKTNKFNALPQNIKDNSVQLHSPNFTERQTTLPSAALITQPHNAGHSTATVVGFSREGAAIVTLHNAQNEGQSPPLALTGTQTQSTASTAAHSPLYLLRAPQLAPESLGVGTQIEVVPQSISTRSGLSINTASIEVGNPASAMAFFLSPGNWPVMNELLQTLSSADPALARAMGNVTPNATAGNAPAQLMPAAMLFVAAMRGGDMQSWMGNKAVDLLRSAGKGDLLNRLGGEGQALARLGSEPLSQDWRAMTLPFLEQGEMQKVALYYKHEDQEGRDGEAVKQTRFVFDMALSQMGKVQVDGLFRGKKLDLIIRTAESLSPDMRQRMRGAYTNALEVSGLSGEVSFQNGEKQYFSVAPKVENVSRET